MALRVANPRKINTVIEPGPRTQTEFRPILTFAPRDKDGRRRRQQLWYEHDVFERPADIKGFTAQMEKDWIDAGFLVKVEADAETTAT